MLDIKKKKIEDDHREHLRQLADEHHDQHDLKAQGLKERMSVVGDSRPSPHSAADDDDDAGSTDDDEDVMTKESEHVHEACADVVVQADGCVMVRDAKTQRQIQVALVQLVRKEPKP
jgi:hypothetical protein